MPSILTSEAILGSGGHLAPGTVTASTVGRTLDTFAHRHAPVGPQHGRGFFGTTRVAVRR
jgi:hypothetical protein